MKKVIIALIFCNVLYSQNSNILSITYEKISELNVEQINNNPNIQVKRKNNLNIINNSIKELEYNLYINDTLGKFELIEKLRNPEFDNKVIALGGGANHFYDIKNKIVLREIFSQGKHKFVKTTFDSINWIIVNETKKINNFVCYKAEGKTQKYSLKKGLYTIEYEAWFCPDFEYSLGPAEYVGLPGLIFEANQKGAKFKFVLKKISREETKITLPDTGLLSPLEEFELLKKIYSKKFE